MSHAKVSKRAKDLKRKLEAEALDTINKWRSDLLLDEWFFELIFPEQRSASDTSDDYGALCDVHADTVYFKAHIRVYPAWFNAPNDVRVHSIVHELCHCLTQQLWDLAGELMNGRLVTEKEVREAVERLTQRISIIAMRGKWPKRTFPRSKR